MTPFCIRPLPLMLALTAALYGAPPAFAAGAGGNGAGGIVGGSAFGGPPTVGNGGAAFSQPGENGTGVSGGAPGINGGDVLGSGGAGQTGLQGSAVSLNPFASVIGGGGGGAGLIIVQSMIGLTSVGGSGGIGVQLSGAAGPQLDNQGLIVGGGGGGGGVIDWGSVPNPIPDPSSARGGQGGAGVLAQGTGVVLVNSGQIWGGGGGGGGRVVTQDSSHASVILVNRGGDGGAGVVLGDDTQRLLNLGEIRGGNAGTGGPSGLGQGGIGVQATGNGAIVTQQGTIIAGLDGNGNRGVAVSLSGTGNTLVLTQGSTTLGDVVFSPSGGNRLQIGGGSTATVALTGNLTFGTTGLYGVRATPTAMDRLDISGQAALAGATVEVAAQAGTYNEHFSQVVLTAGGTFVGSRFAGVTSNLAYLTPSLSYSADDKQVTLTLTRTLVPPVDPGTPVDPVIPVNPVTPVDPGTGGTPLRFADLVSGRNARAVANAVESMPASNSVYGAAIGLPVGAPQGFFAGLSGEAHATVAAGLNNLTSAVRNTPLDQLRSNLAAGSTAGAPTAAAGVSDAAPLASTLPASQARPAWAQLIGNWQSIGASGGNASARQHTGGVFAGADGAVGGGWRLGGAVGYTDSRLTVNDLASRADVSSYSAIVYGGKAFSVGAGKLNLMAGAAYSWHDIQTRRQIGGGGLDQTLTADYGGNTTQVFTELGYAFGVTDGLTLEPYAGVAWAGQRVRGFSESGGSAALSGESSKNDTTTTTLGLRGKQAVTLGTLAGSVSAGLGWRHAFGDLTPASRLAFDAGQAFTVTGAPISRDAALVELGADLAVSRGATIGLAYAGQYASANRDHTGRIEVRWQF